MGRRLVDLTGQTFDRLTVVGYLGREHHSSLWSCRCACGAEVKAQAAGLKTGSVRSCGCYRRERMVALNHKHGERAGEKRAVPRSREYHSWRNMISRCTDPADPSFSWYGERGIQVDQAFLDFNIFLAEVGRRPTPAHTLDRIDTNGHYTPGNVRWATWTEQARNRRNNRIVTYQGRQMTLIEACELSGFAKHVARKRLNAGWGFARAFSEPLHAEKSYAR